jgi:hypothetical protein
VNFRRQLEDASVTTSVALLETSECLERLKTFEVKKEGVPDIVFKSIHETEKYVKFRFSNNTK